MSKTLLFDIQHFGKPGKEDMGAGVDTNKNAKIEIYEQEVYFTSLLAAALTLECYLNNVGFLLLNSGDYSVRHKNVREIAKMMPEESFLYCAGHMNAGKTSAPYYGLVGHDTRSFNGKKIATLIASEWSKKGFVPDTRVIEVSPIDTGYKKNIHNTIAGIFQGPNNVRAVCLELAFLEDTKALTSEGLNAMAQSIVSAFIKFS
jgi:hypothetical protein